MIKDDRKAAAEQQVLVSITLLGIVITVFALITTINPGLLSRPLFAVQLTLAIPFLLASTLGRMKLAATDDQRWERFGFVYWILGYACFTNTLGIIIATAISPTAALIFLAVNMIVPISYSWIAISFKPHTFTRRMMKDAFFISLILIFGLLPALGVY